MKDNQNYTPKHSWADPVAPRCTPIPEDEDYQPRHSFKESDPDPRQEPTSDNPPKEKSYYDENGHIVFHNKDGSTFKVIPERADF